MADHAKRTGAAIESHYQFLTWLAPTIEKLPKSHKFTVGDRIQTTALDVLEALVAVHESLAGTNPKCQRAPLTSDD
jgi:hypothetical protein